MSQLGDHLAGPARSDGEGLGAPRAMATRCCATPRPRVYTELRALAVR